MVNFPAPQDPMSTQYVTGFDEAGNVITKQVDYSELSFFGLYGAQSRSSTFATMEYGNQTFVFDSLEGLQVDYTVQGRLISGRNDYIYGIVRSIDATTNHVSILITIISNPAGNAIAGPWLFQVVAGPAFGVMASATTGYASDSLSIPAVGDNVAFTTDTNRLFQPGSHIIAQSLTDYTQYFRGLVSAYNPSTGAMSMFVLDVGPAASGSYSTWMLTAQDGPAQNIILIATTNSTITANTGTFTFVTSSSNFQNNLSTGAYGSLLAQRIVLYVATDQTKYMLANVISLSGSGPYTVTAYCDETSPSAALNTYSNWIVLTTTLPALAGDATLTVNATNGATVRAAITGDVSIPAASNTATLGNIPTAVTAAGYIVHTNIAAPSSPAAGRVSIWTDSTDLRFHDKNAAGVVGTTVVSDTGASNNFLTAISAAGVISKAQPAFTNISGSVAASQMPALTGDVTMTAGQTVTVLANIPTATPAAGTILHTNIAAPSSPASGKVSVWTDSTDLRFHDKNSAGTIGTTVVSDTGASNNFLTAISAAGVISKAQPSYSNISGTIPAVTSVVGGNQTITATGTIQTDSGLGLQNLSLAASVSSNILTVALKDASGSDCSATSSARIQFRNSTIATGTVSSNYVTSALSITTNATGATLGTANSVPFRLWVLAFDNSGATVLALWQSVTGGATPTAIASLDESSVQSTTAMSGSATSAGTFYTPNGTTLTNQAFRILGYVEYGSGLTTAGTYASTPTKIQLIGHGIKKPGDQVKAAMASTASVASSTSSTYASSNLAASITPSSSANLIRYTFSGAVYNRATTSASSMFTAMHRGSTLVGPIYEIWGQGQQGNSMVGGAYYDAPGTTSSTTYTVKFKSADNVTNCSFPADGNNTAVMTLEEIQV